jgi:predicted nucleotidyltransferase
METSVPIQSIVDRIVKNYGPDKIILFGSFAQGTQNENSDVDLLIVKDSKLPRHRRGREVRKLLYGILVPMDIIVFTNKEIEEDRNLKFSFVYEVLKTGKVLYAK